MRLVYLALGWVAGIVLASTYTIIPLVWLVMMGILGGLIYYFRSSPYVWLIATLFALCFGGFRYVFVPQTSDLAQYNALGGATIEGVIVSEPDYRDDRVQIRVQAETIQFGGDVVSTSGLVLVNAPRLSELHYRDRVLVTGRLSTPATFDTFSYGDFLAREGVFSVMDNTIIQVIDSIDVNQGFYPFAQILRLKNHLNSLIDEALPDPEAALLTGILLGDERGIDPKLEEDFTRVGASHIIAISGFNMAIIAGVVMGTLDRIFKQNRFIPPIIGVGVIAIYTILVGANAAVVRAAVMSSLLFIAPKLNRRTYVPASLAFVAILMSLQNPLVLWDLSFQLSFFAVLGLALFVNPLETQFNRLLYAILPAPLANPLQRLLNEPIVVSVAALIMTLPLIVLYFGRLSLVSLLVNLLIVPVQTALLVLGIVAVLVALISLPIAQVLFWLDMLLLEWSIGVVRYFGNLPFADINFSLPSWSVWGLFIIIIGGAILHATRPKWALNIINFLQRDPVLPTLGATGAGLLILLFSIVMSRPDGNLHIWFLDVSHSNAILMQTPSGAQILIDGGSYPSSLLTALGDNIPFYDREIEVVIITHPDEFDISALPAVLRRYDAGVVLTNGHPVETGFSEDDPLADAIAPFETVIVSAGYTIDMGDGVQIEVLHPQRTPQLGDPFGDHVMVLRVIYEDISFLLTSDLSQNGQIELLDAGYYPLASVMQLPQHGAIRSLNSLFLETVQPQIVVAQYESNNRRGDPDPDVINRFDEEVVLQTGDAGTLHLITDGRTLKFINLSME